MFYNGPGGGIHSMNLPKPYLVGPQDNSWVVTQQGCQPISIFPRQIKAWNKAKRLAKEAESEAVLYNKKGKVKLHESYLTIRSKKEIMRQESEFYRVINHDPEDLDSWWFHPKEKDYFDWLNAEPDRVLLTSAFNMKMFHQMVTMDFSELPKYINNDDKEISSLARYRLERSLV